MNENNCNCENCQHPYCVCRIPIFSGLSHPETCRISSLVVRKHFIKGEVLVRENENMDTLIIVESGQLKAFRINQEGREQILYIFLKGDFLGEKNLLGIREASYSIEAMEETNVFMISRGNFQKLIAEYSEIGLKIIEELCNRIQNLEDMMQNIGIRDAETRVNSLLLEFSGKFGERAETGILVDLPLSREGMANYLGVARETVSRKLSLLNEAGIIRIIGNKKIIILDSEALEESVK